MNFRYLLLLCITVLSANTYAFAPTNFFPAYDTYLAPRYQKSGVVNLSMHVEGSRASNGRNAFGDRSNIFTLYNNNESVIPMLRNPTATVTAQDTTNLLNQLRRLPGGSVTALKRGLVSMSGTLTQCEGALHLGYSWSPISVPGEFSVALHQPFGVKKITNVSFKDLTEPLYAADIKVQNFIKDLKNQLQTMGNLYLGDCQESGFGDTVAQLEWRHPFENVSDTTTVNLVKRINLHTKIGVLFPLASRRNRDKMFSMAIGNDGHWGIPFGAGVTVDFIEYVKTGVSVDFLVLLERTNQRERLKTETAQTNFLLLNTGTATKDPGLTAHFETFITLFAPQWELFANVTYQFTQHSEDRLFTRDDFFDNAIINTAESLKEWHVHNFIFSLGKDFSRLYSKPSVSFFYKLPLKGERVIDNHTFGGMIKCIF